LQTDQEAQKIEKQRFTKEVASNPLALTSEGFKRIGVTNLTQMLNIHRIEMNILGKTIQGKIQYRVTLFSLQCKVSSHQEE